jgi:hypothetical protein
MSRLSDEPPLDVDALLERERAIPSLPASVRVRALRRAEAALLADGAADDALAAARARKRRAAALALAMLRLFQ